MAIGPVIRFLQAARNMAKQGMKKEQILDFARREFGKVSELLKRQIDDIYSRYKTPATGGKKPGEVVPIKKQEGIETLNLKNPKRPGGSLDPAIGLTRTLARRILDKKGIEIGKNDPLDVFNNTFGESILDVKNLAEEMLEIDKRGGGLKDIDQMLEIEGLFDIKIPKNPNRGMTNNELFKILKKDLEEKEILEGFDPTFRKPNAKGGRVKMAKGGLPNILKV